MQLWHVGYFFSYNSGTNFLFVVLASSMKPLIASVAGYHASYTSLPTYSARITVVAWHRDYRISRLLLLLFLVQCAHIL